ncbi:hypothetical protein ACXYTJ_09680 [Gilvimarinus sp. F26214L]|uniref:hypothetical protein n=1 Tax=Gilvimarinus sp. DZF01 TaxID=3461371 RepID=UPI0040461015
MAQDRKEPTLSSIKPERDEIASHQNRLNQRPQSASRPAPPAAPVSGKTSSMAVFAFLLALVGIGVGGFGVWKFLEAEKVLASSNDRIAELEARLNLTNTESDQSVTKIHEKLDWADSEIRKLWGVSYDTNRKAIQTNKSQLEGLDKIAKTAAADAKKASELATQHQSQLATLRTQSSEQQLVLTRAAEEIDVLEQRLREVTDQSNTMKAQVDKLQNSLTARVAGNEEAIKAIDAFRRTANSDIQDLKSRVGGGQ